MTLEVAQALRDEAAEFHALLETLDEKDGATPGLFMEWTPWDVVAHLHFSDLASLAAVGDIEIFEARRNEVSEGFAAKLGLADQARRDLGQYAAPLEAKEQSPVSKLRS